MTEINIFDTYRSQDIDVYFQQEAELDSKVNICYVRYGQQDIYDYVANVAKPDIADYATEKKSNIESYVNGKLDDISDYVSTKQQEMIDNVSSSIAGVTDSLNQQLESISSEVTTISNQVDSIVTTYGTQRITGNKIFDAFAYTANLSNMPSAVVKQVFSPYFNNDSAIPAQTTVGSTEYGLYSYIDFVKSGSSAGTYSRYGIIGGYQKVTTEKNSGSAATVTFDRPVMRMALYKDENTASAIDVGFDGNNNAVVNIPTPPSTASSTQAVTAAWSNAKYADKSLSNLNSTGKASASNLSYPSSTAVELTLGASGTSYTAPTDGVFTVRFKSLSSAVGLYWIQLLENKICQRADQYHPNSAATYGLSASLAVRKGASVQIDYGFPSGATYTESTLYFTKSLGSV